MVRGKIIAVIGVGSIGLRHLQSLISLSSHVNIEVVDPSYQALFNVKKEMIPQKNNIRFFTNISELSSTIDVAIVATTANVRKQVLEELLQQKEVNYLILEKVLFQKLEDYGYVHNMLTKKKVKAWVNCPMRLHPYFRTLREKISNNSKIHYFASGAYLGIGCNTIHHLDLLAYLCKQTDFSFDISKLDETVIKSRRKGFVEFTGTLLGEAKDGSLLNITSYTNDINRPLIIQISCETFLCSINITDNSYLLLQKENNWHKEEGEFRLLLQSDITSEVVNEILRTGTCELTSYEQSMKLHMAMIEAFLQYLSQLHNEEVTVCPIT